ATRQAAMNERIVLLSCLTPRVPLDLSCEGICFGFDFHESSSKQTHTSVKISRFCAFQIDKKAPGPWREVRFEELAIGAGRSGNISADKARHDLTENCNVIFGLGWPRSFKAEMLKGLPQPCEGAA